MKVIIIEDEALAIERLEHLIQRYDHSIEVLARLKSVEEAIDWLQNHQPPDLGFFDIELSDGTCFDIADQVELKFPVIFTTSYDQYALEAFSLKSIDYLLKPIRFERMTRALDKFCDWKQQFAPSQVQTDLKEILEKISPTAATEYKTRWLVKNGNLIQAIPTSDIAYFYSDQKMSLLVTREGKRFPIDQSLDRIMEMMDPEQYFRLNRKYIIHVDAAHKMHPYFKGRIKVELIPPIDDDIVVSSDRTPEFKAWLDR
ncbi:MAG: LytTR family DNA-binding domain-containing protein [Bacteroidia bacterium]|nr:LytTR family DNA-binding domain-containing protein [Bacteroidia bacterium]